MLKVSKKNREKEKLAEHINIIKNGVKDMLCTPYFLFFGLYTYYIFNDCDIHTTKKLINEAYSNIFNKKFPNKKEEISLIYFYRFLEG